MRALALLLVTLIAGCVPAELALADFVYAPQCVEAADARIDPAGTSPTLSLQAQRHTTSPAWEPGTRRPGRPAPGMSVRAAWPGPHAAESAASIHAFRDRSPPASAR